MVSRTVSAASLGGQWDLIGHSGVSAMHAVLRPFSDSILFLERVQATTFAKVQGTSENGNKGEHFAWSTEFSANDGQWRALNVKSNVFCSAGGYLPDGTIVSVAGGQPSDEAEQGYDGIRLYKPCNGTRCDWKQDFEVHLQEKRWYPTVESLANGDLFILGGSNHAASINNERVNVPNFETFPALPGPKKTIDFPFLVETLPHNLYPIVHLLPDKNLFILANTQAVILSTSTWKIIKRLPDIPGTPRNYPLTGGSVILPLTPENNFEPEILVCGGATDFSTQAKGVASCGRIAPLSKNPTWEMEDMPFGRMMPDMAHLADGSIVIVNGADTGTAGFDRASDPVLHPVQYLPNERKGRRFRVWNPSVIARMYHSVAFMLPDSSLLVAGSNPNGRPVEYGEGDFPTEFRVERFSPPYLFPHRSTEGSNDETALEGTGDIVGSPTLIKYGEPFDLSLQWYNHYPENIRVAMVQPGFITHSTHMSQRYVGLEVLRRGEKTVAATGESNKEAGLVRVKAPATNGLAPPGHYMIVVLLDGVPVTEAKWVQLAA
ncbi:MAG: glyoxal oxidase N-terminus-domain-containing protein [Linnemannia gamsii]|nr:MAG: glyoxal oxidase N-terminus-domain-containing protein [Linnemannia gamsii]